MLRNDSYPLEELGWSLTQNALHITHESVDVSLATSLLNDVLVIIVAQPSGQLLIVHLGLVFAKSPSAGNLENFFYILSIKP